MASGLALWLSICAPAFAVDMAWHACNPSNAHGSRPMIYLAGHTTARNQSIEHDVLGLELSCDFWEEQSGVQAWLL